MPFIANNSPMLPERLAFIDLETTGANPALDRVTEIGLVEVDGDRVTTWTTLVNPERPIPAFIQQLTGIHDDMVADAPTFAEVAQELAERLRGRLFIAHNARFDYGFLKHEYQRLGQRFRADVLCSVRLSRRLFPEHAKHNLDSLIARHDLKANDRHRALADADLIWQYWRVLTRELGADALAEAVSRQLERPSLPPHLDPALVDDLPESPGVYRLYGESGVLLHVGRSLNLRQKVLAHFASDTRERKQARIAQEVHRIEWSETLGELGARLLESRLLKEGHPLHNRRPRDSSELCFWKLEERAPGDFRPRLLGAADLDFGHCADLFGPFANPREATTALSKIADAYGLCPVILGLEEPAGTRRPCLAFQQHKCRGACVGKESIGLHSARLMSALAKLKLKSWDYPGPIGLVERNEFLGTEDIHLVDGWRYLGTAKSEEEIWTLIGESAQAPFNLDIYKILAAHLGKRKVVVRQF